MSLPDATASTQDCPSCAVPVDVRDAEPLARIACPHCGNKFRVDRAFDHFMLMETLGVGGMGSVYKARDTRLDRMVALKILRPELSAQPGETARLEQEARLTAAVNHPNVVQLFSSGNDHRQFYLVMELVDHGSLDDLIAQHGKLPEAQVLEVGIQIAHGLQAAQEKGLIHRDIKPANILFANEQTAKIGDFGLAVSTGQQAEAGNEIWGTPYYVAPERLNNEPDDFRSDIFSLGAMLFHAVAGSPPIEGDSTSATELRLQKSRPPDLRKVAPHVSRETARAINRMIIADQRLRLQTYAEVITALKKARHSLEGGTRPRRRRNLALAAAVLVALAVAGVVIFRRPAAVPKAAPVVVPAVEDLNSTLQPKLDEARRQLVAGKTKAAKTAFAQLAKQAQERQPIANWIRVHDGLASLLLGDISGARAVFDALEKNASLPPNSDRELAKFFAEVGHAMNHPEEIGRWNDDVPAGSPRMFTPFLFAMKSWQLGQFAEAAGLLEKFVQHEASGALSWMNAFKPLAQTYLHDARAYGEWKARPAPADSVAGMNDALAAARTTRESLQTGGVMAEELKGSEATWSQRLADRKRADDRKRDDQTTRVREQDTPVWQEAMTEYRAKVAVYDFAGALTAALKPHLNDPGLKSAQQATVKKAEWLNEWKKQFLEDLSHRPALRAITDVTGNSYKGISSADPNRLALTLPYGTLAVPWIKIPPKGLLEASTTFLVAGLPDLADREWRCAVFASETGQGEAARKLGDAAAVAKPAYRQYLSTLSPP